MTEFQQSVLAGTVTTIAMCWKLTRGDGVVLGFTSHDRDLMVDGVRYVSRPGMTPSAISQTAEISADSMEASGPLSSAGLSALDLEAGRWAGANVEMFACDWRAPEKGRLRLMRGSIGAVTRTGFRLEEQFHAELLSEMAQLEEVQPVRLSPLCRAELGDGRCGVDMRFRQVELEASGFQGSKVLLATALAEPGRYAHGRMRWISGLLTGLDRRIADASATELILEEPLPDQQSVAGRIRIWEGCDKRLATCAGRFSNARAFDGEPHVPGTDALLRYGDG